MAKKLHLSETIVIRLAPADVTRLDIVAERTRVPRAMLIRNMILDSLDGLGSLTSDDVDRNPVRRTA
jgi:predicted transcriptional regulator